MTLWNTTVTRMRSWRGPMRGRLNRRLLSWFLVFSLVPLIVTNAIGYRRSHTIIRRLVTRSLTSVAEVQAQHIRDRVDRHVLLLQAIVAGNAFLVAGALHAQGLPAGEMADAATPRAMRELLDEKRRELHTFAALYVYTPAGRLIAASGPESAFAIRIPEPGASAVTVGTSSAAGSIEPRFELVAGIYAHGPAPVAYLGGTVNTSAFGDFLQFPVRSAGEASAVIVDADNHPIFGSEDARTLSFAQALHHPLLENAPASGEYEDNGVTMLGAVVGIPSYPWRIIVQVPARQAFGELRALGGLSLVLELLFGFLLVAAAWLVAADIVAPIGRLVEATRRVGAGHLDVRVAAATHDEIGELGDAFNEMTTELADTTARVAELHQREIERASQLATVGELASGIAHEIKNPVVGVSNGLDLVRRRVGHDPTLTPITDEMSRQLARIQQAMQELLSFARPATPTLAPVDAPHLVDRAIRLVQPTAERAGVTIAVDVPDDLPVFFADEEMLHQALVNVVMNAVQATPAGGRVIVGAHETAREMQLTVRDTGKGIAAENLETVFKPFFTTRHTGTGLGLPITREIAQRHGGGVTIDSRIGAGTTVTIHLPLAGAPEPAEEAAVA